MLSISKRGTILLWVDWLSKWSMIDIFVIVICIAAFRVSISSPDNLGFLPDNFYAIDLLVVPMWGLYSNMIAQIISQVSSHYIIYYHRQIVKEATAEAENVAASEEKDIDRDGDGDGGSDDKLERSNPTSLFLDENKAVLEVKDDDGIVSRNNNNNKYYVLHTHAFRRPHRDNVNETLVVRNWVNYAMLFLGVLLAVTVITGCILPSFSIETLGIIGIAVELGQQFEQAITNHSVISIVQMLFEEANFLNNIGDYIGITVLNCLFLCTVLIIPILQSICLILQWFLPLTTTQRTRMCVLNEILQDWQYIEVYILALFVASW
jgi:small-conductance mechanosensitive channel